MTDLQRLVERVERLEEELSGGMAGPALDRGNKQLAALEASLHEIGHVVCLHGSLAQALRERQMISVDAYMETRGLRGVMRDEYEVSTIAVEILASRLLGYPINTSDVVAYAWEQKNVRYIQSKARFLRKVERRMFNPRCQRLAQELATHLRTKVAS